jgi:serine/threonine protein kinase
MGEELWAGPPDEPDRYTLWAVVGGGGEGKVYRATRALRDGHLDVAVKVMLPDRFGRDGEPAPQVAERWVAQAARLRNLRHPGLVGVQEAFLGPPPHPPGLAVDGQFAYFVMAWVEGRDFAAWLSEQRTVVERLAVLDNVADALDELHSAGQVHADVKPGNVLVRSTALPTGATVESGILVDFGVMRSITGTRPSQLAVTVGYAAPELWQGAPYSPASDLYALAGLILFALTGQHPPVAQDAQAEAAARLRALSVPPPTVDAVITALHPNPAARPPGGCRAWLASARGGLTSSLTGPTGAAFAIPTAPTEAVATLGPPGRTGGASAVGDGDHAPRRRTRWLVAGLASALLVAAAGGGYALAGGDEDPPTETSGGPDTGGDRTATTDRATTTTREPDEVDDPQDAVGLDVEEASRELASAGFAVEEAETIDESVPDGQVLEVSEEAGTVILTVARRPVTRFLTDLTYVDGWADVGLFDLSGTSFTHALRLDVDGCGHTTSVEYDLGRDYRAIVGAMGIDDDSSADLRVRVEVFLDGTLVQTNDIGLGEAVAIDRDVQNVLRLKVQATNLGADYPCGEGGLVIADPQLRGVPSEVPPLTATPPG